MDGLIEKLVDLVNNFDPASLLPKIDSILGWVELFVRICVMAAPLIMLGFGLCYLLLPAKEANHEAGYRFFWGMGSVDAWRFTQKVAGYAWTGLGMVLSVVMFFITSGFRGMDGMEMLDKAVRCILWEIGLIAVCCIGINILLIIRYDFQGRLRSEKRFKKGKYQ